ncbi:YbgC/FadM family acyl-CoA thioesterase [Sulfurimonas sp. SWIR-19]|uniref:YbgC/FadM family acyl-CoA thioesterase n=1 Tax=Sulfurimonas sp. SWIR-19 TaxID=2878390 RepID=UPI001CF4E2B0|nr:YbgC/FadM family acyl-CoA thioesterase [Sulfurimonas sp. SWIR-19]UCN01368.1 YbgC/FadM family acyl-CoA thioesterase [Sulfurimonas sp. SWIR-19]
MSKKHLFKTTVYYEDTDAGGVVYHSKYLNFCERARSNIFFQQNHTPMENGFHFVVKKLTANFLFSAKLGDSVKVETYVTEIKKASLVMKQVMYLNHNDKKLFEMEVLLACLHEDKVSKIPDDFLKLLSDEKELKQ